MKLFIFCFATLFLSANICRPNDKVNDSTKHVTASIVVSGLYQSGNTSKFITQGKGELKFNWKILETIFTFTGTYGENKGKKDDNLYLGTFNMDFLYNDTYSPFILQYLEYNFAKGIDIRSQSGVGLKYTFIKDKHHKTSLSAAGIYEYLGLFDFPGNINHSEIRFSLRLKTRQDFFDGKMTLNFMTMYQPLHDAFSNYNLFIDTSLEFPLSSLFRLNSNYTYAFSSIVSTGRKRSDNRLTFGAGLYF